MHTILLCILSGQFVFYTEPLKSADKQVHIFNPISGKEENFTSSQMEEFARLDSRTK